MLRDAEGIVRTKTTGVLAPFSLSLSTKLADVLIAAISFSISFITGFL
jgi:uncharacterized membrane protein (Fun14 family)